jgi:MFS family permease
MFWPTADVLTGVHALFLGILLLSTYGIAHTYGGPGAGLLAAFIVSMYPMIYGLARHYLLDIPLVAMVALSIWLLLRTDYFERRGAAVICGVSLGLGMLTKWSFAVFVGGPLMIVIVRSLANGSRRRLINVILALAIGAVIAAPWYALNLRSLLALSQVQSMSGRLEGDPAVGSWESWLYYLQGYADAQVLFLFALAFAVGLLSLLMARRPRYETALLLIWIVLPYLAFSLFLNKDLRFTLPYLPATAVITALGLARLRPRVRSGLIALLTLYAVVQFAGLSGGLSNRLPAGWLSSQVSVRIGPIRLPLYKEHVHIAGPPEVGNWQTQSILDAVRRSGRISLNAQPPILMVLSDVPCFDAAAFTYYALVERLPVHVQTITGIFRADNARAQILASDYIIAKTGVQGPAWTVQDASLLTTELQDSFSGLGRQFQLIGEYSLPDGTTGELYRHLP